MDTSGILRKVAGKVAPGRPPAFTEAHALMALEAIEASPGIGRQRLSEGLRLGEGTVRTLIGRLKDLGIIETSRIGMNLTEEGNQVVEFFENLMETKEIPQTTVTIGPINRAVMVRGGARRVERGIEQRDAAIIAGAQGATTLIYRGGHLMMPGMEEPLDLRIERMVLKRMVPREGDAIIIGSSEDPFLAELGAKSAALWLLKS